MVGHRRSKSPPPPLEPLLTQDDTADRCQVSLSTVKRWISSGELPAVHLGKAVRIRPADLDAFIAERVRNRCWSTPDDPDSVAS